MEGEWGDGVVEDIQGNLFLKDSQDSDVQPGLGIMGRGSASLFKVLSGFSNRDESDDVSEPVRDICGSTEHPREN